MARKRQTVAGQGSQPVSPVKSPSRVHFASVAPSRGEGSGSGLSHPLVRLSLLILSVMSISSVLYTVAEPFMDPQRAEIMNSPNAWRSIFLIVSRVVALYIAFDLGLDATRVGAFIAYLRQPFWVLLLLCYDVPLSTVLIDAFVDLASTVGAFSLLGSVSKPLPSNARSYALFQRTENYWLLRLLAISVIAVSLYVLSATGYLPLLIVRTFYPVPSLEPIHNLSLMYATALVSLTGFIVPIILSTPPRIPAVRFLPSALRLTTTSGRVALLATLVFLETVCHTYAAIRGSTFEGAIGYAGGWGLATCLLGAVMMWVESGTKLNPADLKVVEDSKKI